MAFLTYAMMFYGAGDPVKRMFIDNDFGEEADAAAMLAIRAKYGVDKPFLQQFTGYISNIVKGDWGNSMREKRPVWNMVRAKLPISMQIGLVSVMLSVFAGVPLGILSALNHNNFIDKSIVGLSVFVNAIPIYVTGPAMLLLLVVGLDWIDVPFGWKGIFQQQVILPIIVLTLGPLPTIIRQTRAGLLEVMRQDYIRTAHAKGLKKERIMFRHMLRPVLTPVATCVGIILIQVVNGSLFVEQIFGIPGFGKLTIQGVQTVDYPIIMATVIVSALIVMVGNMLVDLSYPLLDPRITRK